MHSRTRDGIREILFVFVFFWYACPYRGGQKTIAREGKGGGEGFRLAILFRTAPLENRDLPSHHLSPRNQQGTKSKGGQAGVGYKGSTEAGSAPKRRDGKQGYVYSLGLRNGKANVDEYSPIYTPDEFKSDGDKYEGNLLYWAATLAGVIGSGALAIYLTSAL